MAECKYLVTNCELRTHVSGLAYRFNKMLFNDQAGTVTWGSTVVGVDEGDGWLKVSSEHGALFLPFSVARKQVIVKATQ